MRKKVGCRIISAAMVVAVSFSSLGFNSLAVSNDTSEEIQIENPVDVNDESVEEATEEVAYETSEEATVDISEEATDETSKEAIENTTDEVAEEAIEETSEEPDAESFDESIKTMSETPVRSGDYKYTVSDGGATITSYYGEYGVINIPETIDGYTVTALGEGLFWGNNSDKVIEVTIPDTVTVIGDLAFANCANLTKVTLPKNLVKLGDSAFSGCRSLSGIVLPDTLESIGGGCFSYCLNVEELIIPKSVTSIGSDAFQHLKKMTFEEGTAQIGDFWLSGANDLVEVIIPETVVSIGKYAFSRCKSLESVKLPNGLTSLGEYAFNECSALKEINLPDTLTTIGRNCFFYCKSLENIQIPKSVTNIDSGAFNNVKKVVFEDGIKEIPDSALHGAHELKEVVIPNSVTRIGNDAFFNCSKIEMITLPESVAEIGDAAFVCQKLKEINLPEGLVKIGSNTFSLCNNLTEVKLPSTLKSIGYGCFYECPIESIVIPKSVTSIGGNAFTKVKKAVFEDGTTAVPAHAFWHGDNLEEVYIPDSVTSIGDEAFMFCEKLSVAKIPENVQSIGKSAFSECLLLEGTLNLKNATEIKDNAFSNCPGITAVEFGDGLKSIGKNGFFKCKRIKNVSIPNGVSVGNDAFGLCTSLTDVVMGDDVEISGYSFYECPLETFVFGKNMKIVEYIRAINFELQGSTKNYAWAMDSLEDGNLYILSSGDIADYAFDKDKSFKLIRSFVKTITISGDIKSIGDGVFAGLNNLEYIIIPEGVAEIGKNAFGGCRAVSYLEFPSTINRLEEGAFSGCNELSEIVFCGDNAPIIEANAFDADLDVTVYYPAYSTGYENGFFAGSNKAKLCEFGSDKASRHIVLLVDNMTNGSSELKRVANEFVSAAGGPANNTRISVVSFGDAVVIESESLFAKSIITQKINEIPLPDEYDPENGFVKAMECANSLFENYSCDSNSIVILSGGETDEAQEDVFAEAALIIGKYNLYTVGIGADEKGEELLTNIAGDKSRYFKASDIQNLVAALDIKASAFEVKFETFGGEAVEAVSVREGSKIIRPSDPVKAGYTFCGWYTDEAFTDAWDFENRRVSEAVTLFAKWTENKTDEAGNNTDISIEIVRPDSYVYTGKAITPAVIVRDGNKILKNKTDYKITYKNNKNACDANSTDIADANKPQVIIKGAGAYASKQEIVTYFTIAQADMADLNVTVPSSLVVKSKDASQKVSVTVKNGAATVDKKNYTVNYFRDKELTESVASVTTAGDYYVVVEAKKENGAYTGNFKGVSVPQKVVVAASAKLMSKAILTLNKTVNCSDDELSEEEAIAKLISTLTIGKTKYNTSNNGISEFVENFEVSVVGSDGAVYEKATLYKAIEKAGKVTVVVSAKEDNANGYVGEIKKELTVKGTPVTAAMFKLSYVKNADKAVTKVDYNGRSRLPFITSKLTYGTDYTVTYMRGNAKISASEVKNVGEYKAVISGVNKYSGTVTLKFTISKLDIAKAYANRTLTVVQSGSTVFDPKGAAPELVIKTSSGVLVKDTDYVVTASGNKNVTGKGKYAVAKVSGKGNYSGTISEKFVIEQKNISDEDISFVVSKVSFKKDRVAGVSFDLKDGETVIPKNQYSYSFEERESDIVLKISAKGKNYYGERQEIVQRNLISVTDVKKIVITVKGDKYYYTGSAITPEVTVTDAEGNDISSNVTVTYSQNTKVGNGKITITGKPSSGYCGTRTVTFTILPKWSQWIFG